jgi:hypothetical protein
LDAAEFEQLINEELSVCEGEDTVPETNDARDPLNIAAVIVMKLVVGVAKAVILSRGVVFVGAAASIESQLGVEV